MRPLVRSMATLRGTLALSAQPLIFRGRILWTSPRIRYLDPSGCDWSWELEAVSSSMGSVHATARLVQTNQVTVDLGLPWRVDVPMPGRTRITSWQRHCKEIGVPSGKETR